MSNPWTEPGAFAPMMDEAVGLRGRRKGGARLETSFAASVFPADDAEPLAASDVESGVRRIEAVAVADALPRGMEPRPGDTLEREDGTRWNVCRAVRSCGLWRIEAREADGNAH